MTEQPEDEPMTNDENLKPKTAKDLLAVIEDVVHEPQRRWEAAKKLDDSMSTPEAESAYAASADAMWKAALAAFNYAAHAVGASGFQASWAALAFYGRAMHIDGPYSTYRAEDLLYPQYDLLARLAEWIESDDMVRWLAEEAQKRLNEADPVLTSPRVVEHWQSLVEKGLALADRAGVNP